MKPSMAARGAFRSCDTEYENASSSRLAAFSWRVRRCTRRSRLAFRRRTSSRASRIAVTSWNTSVLTARAPALPPGPRSTRTQRGCGAVRTCTSSSNGGCAGSARWARKARALSGAMPATRSPLVRGSPAKPRIAAMSEVQAMRPVAWSTSAPARRASDCAASSMARLRASASAMSRASRPLDGPGGGSEKREFRSVPARRSCSAASSTSAAVSATRRSWRRPRIRS